MSVLLGFLQVGLMVLAVYGVGALVASRVVPRYSVRCPSCWSRFPSRRRYEAHFRAKHHADV